MRLTLLWCPRGRAGHVTPPAFRATHIFLMAAIYIATIVYRSWLCEAARPPI